MRKHVLFTIHGMGVFVDAEGEVDTRWSDETAAVFKELYSRYFDSPSFDERFEVVALSYDDVFNDVVQRWASESRAIKEKGVEAAADATKMLGWLEAGADLDDNFAWNHVGDVILYRFFLLVRQRVKARVAKQIHDALKPNADGSVTRWFVLAHSLGTGVIHDTLHAMNTTTPNEDGVSLLDAAVPAASVVAMLANVSKRVETDVDVYQSVVVPPKACEVYISANNRFDPIVAESLQIPERFSPDGVAAWEDARLDEAFLDIEISNVHEVNTHSVKNYLVNPAVHIPILEAMMGYGSIPPAKKQQVTDDFSDLPDALIKARLDELKSRVDPAWMERIARLLPMLEKES